MTIEEDAGRGHSRDYLRTIGEVRMGAFELGWRVGGGQERIGVCKFGLVGIEKEDAVAAGQEQASQPAPDTTGSTSDKIVH